MMTINLIQFYLSFVVKLDGSGNKQNDYKYKYYFMQINKNQQIRKNRQEIRNNIKLELNLKLRQTKISLNYQEPCSDPLKNQILDTRDFQNVFIVLSKIGQGASGVVKKCKQIKTGKIFAVKILKGDQQYVRITKRSYQILKLFEHESIIKAKYLFIDERKGMIFLVMEYCQFSSLRILIDSNPFSINNCKKLIKKLLEALAQLHSKNVCHRDLKPENILYDKQNNQIKLIDFGVSKVTFNRKKSLKQKMWTVTGTIQYKAPQMFTGGQYDQSVDLWAVGVLTYEIIYGCYPFDSQYTTQIIQKITQSEPIYKPLQGDSSESLLTIDFIKALLKKNRQNRINCLTALRHPWIQSCDSKKSTSYDCFTSQFLNRERKTTEFEKLATSEYYKNKNQKINWNKFQQCNDILEIRKQIGQIQWVSMKRSISKDIINDNNLIDHDNQQNEEQCITFFDSIKKIST